MSIMSNFGELYFGPYGSSKEFFIAGAPLDPMVAKPKNMGGKLQVSAHVWSLEFTRIKWMFMLSFSRHCIILENTRRCTFIVKILSFREAPQKITMNKMVLSTKKQPSPTKY